MLHIDRKYLMLLSPRLEKFKRVREDLYNFRCPYCGDSAKLKNKARGYFYRKKVDMFYRCHNCGMGTTFSKVLQWIDADLYKEFVLERYKDSVPNTEQPEFKFEPPKFKKKDPNLKDLIPINTLNADHPARQYVANRLIPEEFYSDLFLCHKFSTWAKIQAEEHPRLVIPFRDETGEVVAAQGRAFFNEQPRYLTLKFSDQPKIFGMDRVSLDEIVYVVEGPIDSLFIPNCIAVAGSDFGELPLAECVIIMDNERRNKEVVRTMEKLIGQDYPVVIWPDTVTAKDINQMILDGLTSAQVCDIIKENTYSGLTAMMKIAEWKKI